MSRKVIAFVSTKGGVGKTTIASNFAVEVARTGKKVLFFNADPQQGAMLMNVRRTSVNHQRDAAHQLPLIESMQWKPEGKDLDTFIEKKLKTSAEVIVLDVRGSDGRDIRGAMLAADLVVFPTVPTASGYDALINETLPMYYAMPASVKAPGVIVVNQFFKAQQLHKAVIAQLDGCTHDSLSVCETKLRYLADYQNAWAVGMGVSEYKPKQTAALEFQKLYTELSKLF